MPNFDVYSRAIWRLGAEPTVTIQARRGLISFSPSAITALGEPEAIIFMYDKDKGLAGFRAARPGETNGFKVRKANPRGIARMVSATDFCRFIGADPGQSRRYPLEYEDGQFYIDLKQTGTPVTSNRRKKS